MPGDHQAFERKLAQLLRREFPGAQGEVVAERLSGGANQETYKLTAEIEGRSQHLCLRRAAVGDAAAHSTITVEAELMKVAREAGVPEPEVYHVLEPGDGLGQGFLMQWLEGETLGAKIARAPEFEALRGKLAYQCGEILGRIHGIDLEATGLRQRLPTIGPKQFIHKLLMTYQGFQTPQPMIDFTARWLLDHLPKDPTRCLVHNDFRNGNLMVGAQGISAVLDWEIAHVGAPMRDLGWLCTRSWRFGVPQKPVGGFGEYADLFAGYESVTGRQVSESDLRFWEIFGSYWWAVESLAMADHYRQGQDSSVERPAIARRSSECQVDCVNLLIPGPVALLEPLPDYDDEMPRIDELLTSVRDFLHRDVMSQTRGRTSFLARVAGNSLEIVLRDAALGRAHRSAEHARLRTLLGIDGPLSDLRWILAIRLRDGFMPLDTPGLAEHLRTTVVNQVAIDQPKYPGLKSALSVGSQ